MNDTYNWFYNPNFVNQQNYWQHQNEIMQYQLNQQKETLNAYKAMRDFLDAVEKLDLSTGMSSAYCFYVKLHNAAIGITTDHFKITYFYYLLHIKPVGEQMSICYQFVGWDVVDEFDVV